VIALVQQIVALGATYTGAVVGWEATNRLRLDLMRHCLGLDLPFHKNHTPGELIERIDGDVTLLANFFSQFTINILGNALLVVGILIVLTRTNPWLGLGLTAYCVVTGVVLRAVQQRAVRRHATDRQASAEQYGAIEERLVGTEDIRGIGAERYVLWRLLGVMQRRLRTNRSARLAGNISFFATNFLYVMAYAIGLALAAFLFQRHQITIGTAYLIVFYIGLLAAHLDNIQRQMQDMQQASAGIGRVDTLLHVESTLPEGGVASLPAGPLDVQFDRVSFGYEEGESVLRDLSFSLEPGETLGLLGRTGSGKTTLTRLLARLYDPTEGRITLDGVDLKDYDLVSLRHAIGVIFQDFVRYDMRFDENIGVGEIESVRADLDKNNGTPQSISAAAENSLAASLLPRFTKGYQQMLGRRFDDGVDLSGGEWQKIALARAYIRDAQVLILDEPTAALDARAEYEVFLRFSELVAGRMAVLISHRFSTVRMADRIIVLRHGKVEEQGSHEELLAKHGLYEELFTMQAAGYR
jgi:ABC-type multidrug transport system fused ATPase/permease subunit